MLRLAPAAQNISPLLALALFSHRTLHMIFSVSLCVATHTPRSIDHTLILPSVEPDSRYSPVSDQSREVIHAEAPAPVLKMPTCSPV